MAPAGRAHHIGDDPAPQEALLMTGSIPTARSPLCCAILLFATKVADAGTTEFLLAQIGIERFGHCEFTLAELLAAFNALGHAVMGDQA
jgi:hypothetical protein